MAEKDYETIEGGDDSSDAFDFESTQPKVATKDKDEGSTSKEEDDFRDRPAEEHRVEGGDTDYDEDEGGADLDDSGEEEVEKPTRDEGDEFEVELDKTPKVGEEIEVDGKNYTVSEVKGEGVEDVRDKQAMEDAIKYLDESGGTKYIVKGREYDLRDLTPQEFRDRFSKAGRFEQRMQEMSAKEKLINERERLAEDGARKSQEIMRRYQPSEKGEDLPDILKPTEDDTDLERSLKEMNANLYSKVDKLERGFEQQDFQSKEQQLYRQLDSLEQEFPMLSKSEVVAVKSMPEYAHVDIRLIAENSHNARMSDEYLDAVRKARPEYFRELGEKTIEEHLMKNPRVSKVSRKKSSTVASGKVSSGKKKTPRTLEQIEAHVDRSGGWDNIIPDSDED